MTRTRILSSTSVITLLLAGAAPAFAADHSFSLPAGSLSAALKAFAAQSGDPLVASPALVSGHASRAVTGMMSDADALHRLLAGSGLHAERIEGAWVIRPDAAPSQSEAPNTPNTIVVTGTRIRGAAPIGAPLTVIDRSTIEQSGRATVADYIQTLPQNYAGGPNESNLGTSARNGIGDNLSYGASINLRGLGAQSTLVLFDGNRPALGGGTGAFVDLSLVPATAIDRIEILTDGASAIYGTDAVAGVVNVRFRDRLNGFETSLYSGTADGAFGQYQLSQAAGKRWSSGGFMVAAEYDFRGALAGADRSVATDDLTRFGGPDYRLPYGAPGNLIADDGSIYAIPAGQNGRTLTASELLPGQTHLIDEAKRIDILPEQKSISLYAAADQQLGAGITAYGRALYAHRRFDLVTNVQTFRPVTVPTTNPFYVDPIGTGQPVTVQYDFAGEVGAPRSVGTVNALTTSGGFKGNLGPWAIDLSGSYGRQVERNFFRNLVSYSRVAQALADTDPATALNLFGDGTGNNPATIDTLRAQIENYSRYTVWSTSLRFDGPLFDLPAGTVKLATGYEHRDESFTGYQSSTTASTTPQVTPEMGTPGHRNIDAIYGELAVPLLGPETARFPGRLDLSVAGRVDWYSDVGRTINPKVGARWEPVTGLAMRASWGTSFRAPGFTENVGDAHNFYEPFNAPDPQSPTGFTPVLGKVGTGPFIGPEKARSWTVGIDFKPHALPGLTLNATYFDIEYRDRIDSANADGLSFLEQRNIYGGLIEDHPDPATIAAFYANPNFFNPLGIPASSIAAILNLETLNMARETERGVDFDIAYAHKLFGGTGSLGVTGTRLLALDRKITSTAPPQSVLGTLSYPVKLRLRGHAGWTSGGFDATAFVNYTDGYVNQLVTTNAPVSSWTTIDGQIGYRFAEASPLHGARFSLSAVNLFNRKPPYVENHYFDSTLAFDPSAANAIGRVISIQANFSW